MTTFASGTFHNESWDEETLDDRDGRKLTRATIRQRFEGDLVGTGAWTTIMCYAPDGTAEYVGMHRIDGVLGDRAGSLVVSTIGIFDGTVARTTWTVVRDSGVGALAGIRGRGHAQAPHGPDGTYTLEAELE